jgi:hypothetical protein
MVECYLHTISPPAELSKLRIFIQGQCLQHMKKHSFSFIEKDLRCFTYMWTSWWERSRERVIQRRPGLVTFVATGFKVPMSSKRTRGGRERMQHHGGLAYLHQFKTNGKHPQKWQVTDHDCLPPPSQSMCYHKLIEQCFLHHESQEDIFMPWSGKSATHHPWLRWYWLPDHADALTKSRVTRTW